ncbi:MAG: hypothetical protein WAU99_21500, partial [Pseudolabrys sp.]
QSVTDLVELERFNDGHDDFHGFDPRLGPFCTYAVRAGSLSRAYGACFAGMAGQIESNAVPDALQSVMILIRLMKSGWPSIECRRARGCRLKTRQ